MGRRLRVRCAVERVPVALHAPAVLQVGPDSGAFSLRERSSERQRLDPREILVGEAANVLHEELALLIHRALLDVTDRRTGEDALRFRAGPGEQLARFTQRTEVRRRQCLDGRFYRMQDLVTGEGRKSLLLQ